MIESWCKVCGYAYNVNACTKEKCATAPSRHPNESTEDFCRRVADWAGVAAEQKTQEDR